MKAWYLLYCKPRNESRAQQNLALQNLETYLPMISAKKSQRGHTRVSRAPLFPNYLFINFDPCQTSVQRINSTRGVSRIVNCNEKMHPIDERIIHAIRMKEINASPSILDDESNFKNGEKIRFKDGPFIDLEGIFQEQCPNKRCKVLFSIMGQSNMLSVPVSSVERI